MEVNITTTCSGRGFWSNEPGRVVRIEYLEVAYLADTTEHGELCAYFAETDWDPKQDGLIYTDPGWMETFRRGMEQCGFTPQEVDDISYTEAGMQGEDYVSMDFGKTFFAGWKRVTQSITESTT